MEPIQIVFGIILLIFAVFLIVAVLLQSGKSHSLGTIAGSAETFFGKTKGKTLDKMLSKLTSIVAVCFVLLVIIVFVIQDDNDLAALYEDYLSSLNTETSETADASETTTADQALTDAGVDTSAADETAAEDTAAEEG
ncbi:MAG: preprotein translocase subunit SecG [Eubacteriales bacterium]|jgi:preprotein translocase subunit SecG|nr:preprotein translocase subunit SecG [Clostridiales bacterium]